MIKTIHCIKVGPLGLGEHDRACIRSWMKVYPDFQIRVWNTQKCWDKIQDCSFAVDAFRDGKYNFSIDYLRLKILYEEGGLYLDTDVFALQRIPDIYFEKAWLSWDDRFESQWTNNGTGCYSDPGNPIFLEFLDLYRSLTYQKDHVISNDIIDLVLKKHGLDVSDRLYCSLSDQSLDFINILNRVQFGVNDYLMYQFLDDGRPKYLMHGQVGSWTSSLVPRAGIYYTIIDDETTEQELLSQVDDFINLKTCEDPVCVQVFVGFINGTKNLKLATDIGMKLHWFCPKDARNTKIWAFYPIGSGLSRQEALKIIPDYISKRYHWIFFARNIGTELGKIQDWEKNQIVNF